MRFLRNSMLAAVALASLAAATVASAQQALTPEQLANLRIRVETAANLAVIAETEKDGQMMLLAAKLMASVGPVARPGKTGADGKPELFDVKAMLSAASGMGAVDDKAAAAAMSSPLPARDYCAIGYWRETCDYNNYCRWEYVC